VAGFGQKCGGGKPAKPGTDDNDFHHTLSMLSVIEATI
jgi:hypothetical protein